MQSDTQGLCGLVSALRCRSGDHHELPPPVSAEAVRLPLADYRRLLWRSHVMHAHHRLLIPLSVLALSLSIAAPAVRAQAQPSAARHVFIRMQHAMQKAASVHIVYHTALVPLTPPYTGQELLSGVADISPRQRIARLRRVSGARFRTPPSLPSIPDHGFQDTFVVVANREAHQVATVSGGRARSNSRSYCSTLTRAEQSQWYDLTSLPPIPRQPKRASMLAPSVVADRPVWQIKITQQRTFSILSIAKDDFLLLRDAVSRPHQPGTPEPTTTTVYDFSRYGEQVTASLPKQCR